MSNTIKTAILQVTGANVRPANDGNYYITAVPTNPADAEINPTNLYGFTKAQLIALSASHGMPNYYTLLAALNRKDSHMTIVAELCKVGEEFVDQAGNVRRYGYNIDGTEKPDAKDWWKVDSLQTEITLGRFGQAFASRVEEQVLIAQTADAYNEAAELADHNRKRMLEMAAKISGKSVDALLAGNAPTGLPDPADKDMTGGKKAKGKN